MPPVLLARNPRLRPIDPGAPRIAQRAESQHTPRRNCGNRLSKRFRCLSVHNRRNLMRVEDVMTVDVATVTPETSLKHVARELSCPSHLGHARD